MNKINSSLNKKISYIAEVYVRTATAIIANPNDPYQVLVGMSIKHPYPVLPGGKLEVGDVVGNEDSPGLTCVMREVLEETGCIFINPKYIGKAEDPNRDIRIVSLAKLIDAITEPSLDSLGLLTNSLENGWVKAHYGIPDFIYLGTVDINLIKPTHEIKNHKFIDIRELRVNGLSAGHDIIAFRYRQMLNDRLDKIPENSLRDFTLERESFLSRNTK